MKNATIDYRSHCAHSPDMKISPGCLGLICADSDPYGIQKSHQKRAHVGKLANLAKQEC